MSFLLMRGKSATYVDTNTLDVQIRHVIGRESVCISSTVHAPSYNLSWPGFLGKLQG